MSRQIKYNEAVFDETSSRLKTAEINLEEDFAELTSLYSVLLGEWEGLAVSGLEKGAKSLSAELCNQIQNTEELQESIAYSLKENQLQDQAFAHAYIPGT